MTAVWNCVIVRYVSRFRSTAATDSDFRAPRRQDIEENRGERPGQVRGRRIRRHRPADAAQGGPAAAHRSRPVHRRLQPESPGARRDGALALPAREDPAHRLRPRARDGRRSRRIQRRRLRRRRPSPHSAQSPALDAGRHEAHRPRRRRDLRGPSQAASGGEGAPRGRSRRDGGRRNKGRGARRRRSRRDRVPRAPLGDALRGRAERGQRRAVGVGRGAGQRAGDTVFGDREATDRAFAAADRVVGMKFNIGRCTAVALEPRAALGSYDAGRYTLYAGSGGAVRYKKDLAAVLGIDPGKLRVITCDVGGNFGSKNRVYVEYGLVLWASRKLGRPVKFTASRSEAFLSDYQGRDLVTEIELALRSDGKFLAMRASNLSNVGARCLSLSPLSKGSGLITGCYDIPAATLRSRAVFTTTAPTNPYRSPGRPEVNFA